MFAAASESHHLCGRVYIVSLRSCFGVLLRVSYLFRFCLFLPLLLLMGGLTVLALCIESSPLVVARATLSPANVVRAKALYRQHQSGLIRSGESREILLHQGELNLLATYFAERIAAQGAELELSKGVLVLRLSWDISAALPYREQADGYLNLRVVLVDTGLAGSRHGVGLQSLGIGRLVLPVGPGMSLLQVALEYFTSPQEVLAAASAIQSVKLLPSAMAITYQWPKDLVATWRGRLVSSKERQALADYQQFLVAEVRRQGQDLSFTRLLEAVFGHGLSGSPMSDPVIANRAAIIVLAAYANGGGLTTLVPEARDWPRPRRAHLSLAGRSDLVQHFMTSAALAVLGGRAVANSIGLYKEIEDARAGSGFSFKDLAADLAGARFGEVALQSHQAARQLQERLAAGQGNSQLLPSLQGLPENLKQARFQRDYGGLSDPRYRRIVHDIESRINGLALYP